MTKGRAAKEAATTAATLPAALAGLMARPAIVMTVTALLTEPPPTDRRPAGRIVFAGGAVGEMYLVEGKLMNARAQILDAIADLLLNKDEIADVANRAGVPDLLYRLGSDYMVIACKDLGSRLRLLQAQESNPFFVLVATEVARAQQSHPPLHSAHEALAVIEEEFEELKREVFQKQRDRRAMLGELIQFAAMCVRMAGDLRLLDELKPE